MPKLPTKPKGKPGKEKEKEPSKKPVPKAAKPASVEDQLSDLTERLAMVEAGLLHLIETQEADAEDKDDEAVTAPPKKSKSKEPEIPGFTKTTDAQGNDAREIDSNAVPTWNESQMLAVAEYLEADLTEYKGQPREMRRQLYELLEEYGLTSSSEPPTKRDKAKKATPPINLPKGKDGLPTTSPIVGTWDDDAGDDPHVEREDWRVKGKFFQLHLLAEAFREDVVKSGKWVCEGFNCHDCIEELGNANRLVHCHRTDFKLKTPLPAGISVYVTDVTPEDDEMDWAKGLTKYAKKVEAQADEEEEEDDDEDDEDDDDDDE